MFNRLQEGKPSFAVGPSCSSSISQANDVVFVLHFLPLLALTVDKDGPPGASGVVGTKIAKQRVAT